MGIDDRAAAREAAEHLTRLGHRRFAAIAFALSPDGAAGVSWPDTPVSECPGRLSHRLVVRGSTGPPSARA